MLQGQPLHPIKHALQIFTDASKEGWGAHLDEHTARGTWSLPESKLHILGGGHIMFAFSAVRRPGVWRPTWFPDILGNSSYPIFTKFGMQVYWVNSLYGIAFGDDSSIAN